MKHERGMTVIGKTLSQAVAAVLRRPGDRGVAHVNEYMFERHGGHDGFWHMGVGTLVKGLSGVAALRPAAGDTFDAHVRSAAEALGCRGGRID